jgi:hypothetical protein
MVWQTVEAVTNNAADRETKQRHADILLAVAERRIFSA